MVELKEEELPFLIGKSWALQDRLRCEINGLSKTSSGLCRSCRVRGQYVLFFNNKPSYDEEKERLVGIRDSIRDVGHMLSSLQKLGERQRRCREVVETSLEESWVRLMKLVRRHQGTSAHLLITREMEASFGQMLSVTRKSRNDDRGRRRKLGPKSIWRWVIRILSPFVEWERTMWTLIELSLSISAFHFVTRFRLEAGGGEDFSAPCVVTNIDTLDIFHGRG